jgi:hypothetical protein
MHRLRAGQAAFYHLFRPPRRKGDKYHFCLRNEEEHCFFLGCVISVSQRPLCLSCLAAKTALAPMQCEFPAEAFIAPPGLHPSPNDDPKSVPGMGHWDE